MKLTPIGGAQNDSLYRAENGTIYVRKYRVGKGEICRSTKTIVLTKARIVRDRLLAEVFSEKNRQTRQTVAEAWAIWFEGIQNTKAFATVQSVRSSWAHLEPYFGDLFLDEVTAERWTNVYIPAKRREVSVKFKRPNPNRKFYNDWKWFSTFLKWAQETGRTQSRPKLLNPDPPLNAGRALSNDEIEALLQNSSGTLHLQILIAVTMGMRASEIAKLRKDRVDTQYRVIRLRPEDTKIRKGRSIPVSSRVWPLLVKQMQNDSDFVFPHRDDPSKSQTRDSKATAWETCRRLAAIRCRFHDLRHTFLTNAFKSGASNAALICFFAGLSLEEAQRTYLHFSDDDLRHVAELVTFEA